MGIGARAVCAALVVAGTCVVVGAPSVALAQRPHPEVGHAASPPPSISPMTTPYPGATVTIDPRWYGVDPFAQWPYNPRGLYTAPPLRQYDQSAPVVYYAPYYVPYYGVNDVNGQPLASYFQSRRSAPSIGLGDPDLRGSPYVVVDGGAMVVDFGSGGRRTVPACAAVAAAQTPDGQPRTVFYTPPADGVILRAGAQGRVLGTPDTRAQPCYAVDQYGRMVLDY